MRTLCLLLALAILPALAGCGGKEAPNEPTPFQARTDPKDVFLDRLREELKVGKLEMRSEKVTYYTDHNYGLWNGKIWLVDDPLPIWIDWQAELKVEGRTITGEQLSALQRKHDLIAHVAISQVRYRTALAVHFTDCGLKPEFRKQDEDDD